MKHFAFACAFVLAFTFNTFAASTSQTTEKLSKMQVATLTAQARTPAEHRKIADYYRAESRRLLAESYKHIWMGADYARNPAKGVRNLSDHCALLAKSLKAESVKDRQLADQHEQMAKAAEQN